MKKHVVLVGLSGSGKTTAGKLAADELGAPFIDIDTAIESDTGKLIADIFAASGESAFRALERLTVAEAVAGAAAVIAPGGGWASHPGNLEAVSENVFTIYLQTSTADAAARLADSADRPLLQGDRTTLLAGQISAREPFYRRTAAVVQTAELTVVEVGAAVAELARKSAGW